MYCKNCGMSNNDDARFRMGCGCALQSGEAGMLTRTSTPVQVELNVSGQEWLYFRMVREERYNGSPLMADPVLYK